MRQVGFNAVKRMNFSILPVILFIALNGLFPHSALAVSGFAPININSVADGATSVYALDVDGDSDIDVLSASSNDDTISWYENDPTPPQVSTITRVETNPTNANTVTFLVSFTESVSGLAASDFAISESGVTGSSISGILFIGGSNYRVSVTTGNGEGTLGINITDDDSVLDAADNPLGGAGAGNGSFTSGEVYNLDQVKPTVAITSTESGTTRLQRIPVTITFAENVSGFVLGDLQVSGGTLENFSGSGATYSVELVPSGLGVVSVDFAADVAADTVGNLNSDLAFCCEFGKHY